jgi:membrane protease subunit (stomatin/prohibitin family)
MCFVEFSVCTGKVGYLANEEEQGQRWGITDPLQLFNGVVSARLRV